MPPLRCIGSIARVVNGLSEENLGVFAFLRETKISSASHEPPPKIPKGLRPPAQGCRPAATLGPRPPESSTSKRLRQSQSAETPGRRSSLAQLGLFRGKLLLFA
jgi:hypothetical protein